jgi:hypothetical protein
VFFDVALENSMPVAERSTGHDFGRALDGENEQQPVTTPTTTPTPPPTKAGRKLHVCQHPGCRTITTRALHCWRHRNTPSTEAA